MADAIVEACVSAARFTLDNTVITEHKCAYYSELERKLKEVLDELSSTQLILKLLQEESTQDKLCNSCQTTYHSIDYPPEEKLTNVCNKRTMATYNHHKLLNKCDNKENFQQIQFISTANCYHPLTNLQEDLESVDALATSQVAVNEDSVKEPGIQPLETTMNVSSKRL
jgi:hypothetical protein